MRFGIMSDPPHRLDYIGCNLCIVSSVVSVEGQVFYPDPKVINQVRLGLHRQYF